jgi:hypothetical protein
MRIGSVMCLCELNVGLVLCSHTPQQQRTDACTAFRMPRAIDDEEA